MLNISQSLALTWILFFMIVGMAEPFIEHHFKKKK